jgi:lipoate-protein ligase A
VAENLALDEALLIQADLGQRGTLVRFWEPAQYAVVLGASCRLRDDVHVDACRADGVPILRRTSGGGTVVVGPGALCVTVILRQTAAPGLRALDVAHDYVLERIGAALEQAGTAVTLEGRGDLVLCGRKCAGSAQRRLKDWFMIHCSLLYQFPIERIESYLALPKRQPAYRAGRSHRDFLSNLPLARKILVHAIGSTWSDGACPGSRAELPFSDVRALVSEKFGNPLWTERF